LRDPASENWHLDKRIPVALIIALLMQFGLGVWWIASIEGRVTSLEEKAIVVTTVPIDISGMKEQLRGIEKSLERVEKYIDSIKGSSR